MVCAVSTDAGRPGPPTQGAVRRGGFDLDRPWRLGERVAVRPEPFGSAAVPLRHPAAVVPEGRHRAGSGAQLGRASHRPFGLPGGGRRRQRAASLRAGTGRAGPVEDDHPAAWPVIAAAPGRPAPRLVDLFELGLISPICLTPPTAAGSTLRRLDGWPPAITSMCRSQWTVRPPPSTTRCGARDPMSGRCGRWNTWRRPDLRGSSCRW